ncbi:MAG: UTP--glucose-1-phosphate uridylyltransferase GalU [Firmicutes bacterium]|nr:UTP--glucose-1-phosphate uridylyltransferase GalU [Bacillota bacterium]
MKVRKAIIPAAGLGTRFLPATKAQPKEMLPIVDKPAIQYIVEEAVASGIEEILIVTGRNKGSMEDHFDRNIELELALKNKDDDELLSLTNTVDDRVTIHYVRQKTPLGLGHAVGCARTFVADEPFAVLLGDDIVDNPVPCTKQLIDIYEQCQCTVLGVQEVAREAVDKYGILKVQSVEGSLYRVEDLVEKPAVEEAPSHIALLGRYVITPEIFAALEKTVPGKQNEIQLTDALRILGRFQDIYAYHFAGKRYDVGNKLGFLEATVEFALKRPDLAGPFREYLAQLMKTPLAQAEVAVSKGKDPGK